MFPIHAMPLTLGSPGGTGAVLSASCSACFASSGGSCPTKRSGASAPGCCAGAKRSRAVAWRSATRGPWDEMILTKNAGKIVEKRHIIFFNGFLWEFAVILEELNGISLGYHHHWGYGDWTNENGHFLWDLWHMCSDATGYVTILTNLSVVILSGIMDIELMGYCHGAVLKQQSYGNIKGYYILMVYNI